MGTEYPKVWLTDQEIELIRTALTVFEMTYLKGEYRALSRRRSRPCEENWPRRP